LTFRPLEECRAAYAKYIHADDIDWDSVDEPGTATAIVSKSKADSDIEWEPDPDLAYELARERELTDDAEWEPDPDQPTSLPGSAN
jgi:hypothetical protein